MAKEKVNNKEMDGNAVILIVEKQLVEQEQEKRIS